MLKNLLVYFAIMVSSFFFFLIFVLVFLNGTEITCTRQADSTYTCNTHTLLLNRFPAFRREVAQVVDVEIVDDGCSDGCSYRAEFVTASGGHVAVNEVYTDYNPVSRRVNDLKSRLNSGQASFEYKIEPLWWVLYLLGGLFVMEAAIVTLTMGVRTVRDYFANRDKLPA